MLHDGVHAIHVQGWEFEACVELEVLLALHLEQAGRECYLFGLIPEGATTLSFP